MKKHHLSKWMFASDVVRATIVLIIPLLHFSHLLPLWLLISLMVIQSATGAAYNPASVAILPQIVPKHLIQKANAILQSSFEIVALAAVMVAGLLVKLIGPADTLLITTALFVISGLFIIGVKLKKTDEEKAAGIKQAKNTYLYNLKEGFSLSKPSHFICAHAVLYLNECRSSSVAGTVSGIRSRSAAKRLHGVFHFKRCCRSWRVYDGLCSGKGEN